MKTLDHYEYLRLLNELDLKHGSFYHLWEMGKPRFVEGEQASIVRTGAVTFNKDGKFLEFLINEEFWDTLSFTQKTFLIAHECLHVTYNHGYRLFRHAKNQNDAMLMNWACDIVINHRLLELGFVREDIDPDLKFCWLDTVFPNRDDILPNRSSEYYYTKLKEQQEDIIEQLKEFIETVDQHGSGSGSGSESDDNQDNDGSGEFQDMTDVIDELADHMSDEELNDLKKDFEKHHKDLDDKINSEVTGPGSTGAGSSPGNIFKQVDVSKKVKPKDKWETVIKKWVKKTRLEEFRVEDQWARTARRFQFLKGSDLMLPNEMETDEPLIEKHKVGIYFFLDTSGSCAGFSDRFWTAAKSVPKDVFDVRLFCFDTRVYETTLASGKLYGFGGTSFQPIENKIQSIMSTEGVAYPDAVFLITDGYGNTVSPQFPDRWHWFMTPSHSTCYVPKESKVHKLSDFE